MSKILDNIKDFENSVQDKIQGKLKRGEILTDGDLKAYKLTSEDMEMMDILGRLQDGETIVSGFFADNPEGYRSIYKQSNVEQVVGWLNLFSERLSELFQSRKKD